MVVTLKSIRENPDLYRENEKKRFGSPEKIDNILLLDAQWKSTLSKAENLSKLKNIVSKKFSSAPTTSDQLPEVMSITNETVDKLLDLNLTKNTKCAELDLYTKTNLRSLSALLTERITKLTSTTKDFEKKINNEIKEVGNILADDVVIAADEAENAILHTTRMPENRENLLSHIDLMEKLGFVDCAKGSTIAGNRGYFLTGLAVKLNQALLLYATDFLEKKSYKLMETPHMINGPLISQISQLSDYEETLYKIADEDRYLIATSEQPLTAYFANSRLTSEQLPLKLGGISSCYRKEAGAHGRNTRGIFRVHQFSKVEQFCVCSDKDRETVFNSMIETSKEFYDSLGLSYRVISIVSGALNNSASKKYDLEAWFPGSGEFYELVSCSDCTDYFSTRINAKYDDSKYLQMLNCTLCANTRTLCCLVETYQTPMGLTIPPVLMPYLNGLEFVSFLPQ